MRHRATQRFWQTYRALPQPARAIADKNFKLLKVDQRHPSLHFKRIGRTYSVRVGLDYRALALVNGDEAVWFLDRQSSRLRRHPQITLIRSSSHRTFILINPYPQGR